MYIMIIYIYTVYIIFYLSYIIIYDYILWPPTEFWKWKKVHAPQVSQKVRPGNQDAILEKLPIIKKMEIAIFGTWSSQKKNETNVYKSLSSTMQN